MNSRLCFLSVSRSRCGSSDESKWPDKYVLSITLSGKPVKAESNRDVFCFGKVLCRVELFFFKKIHTHTHTQKGYLKKMMPSMFSFCSCLQVHGRLVKSVLTSNGEI